MIDNNTKKVQKNFYDEVFSNKFILKDSNFSETTKYFNNRFLDGIIGSNHKKILEIGCGNGLLTFFLLKRPVDITAIDLSKKAIDGLSKQFINEIKQKKLKLVHSDIINFLKNTDEKFDVIIGSGIIHHIDKKDWDDFFKFSYKKLNSNGVFACAPEPNAGGLYYFFWPFAKFFYKLFGMDYNWEVEKGTLNMKPGDLLRHLKNAGFKNSKILSFQSFPNFQFKFLIFLNKKIANFFSGRFSMYMIIKGEKPSIKIIR